MTDGAWISEGRQKLKVCPFCRGFHLELSVDRRFFAVHCEDCDAMGPLCESEDEAAVKWNRPIRSGMQPHD